MAQKYKLIERRNLGKDQAETPRKMYAQAVNNGYVSFDELCKEIGEGCTLTSFRFHLAMDTLVSLAGRFPLPGLVRDLHPLDDTHDGQTKTGDLSNRGKISLNHQSKHVVKQ